MAHYLFFGLFIPVIQAVTLAGDNERAELSVTAPGFTRCQRAALTPHGGQWRGASSVYRPNLSHLFLVTVRSKAGEEFKAMSTRSWYL